LKRRGHDEKAPETGAFSVSKAFPKAPRPAIMTLHRYGSLFYR
jgi:hypothetical protein